MGNVIQFPIIARPRPTPRDDLLTVAAAGYELRKTMTRFARAAISAGELDFAVTKLEKETAAALNLIITTLHARSKPKAEK